MEKIAIIGAGISGLSAARFLKDRYKVIIFEKEEIPGGLVKCRRVNDSLFHTCGGHVFNSKRQDVTDWFWKFFDRESEFHNAYRNSVVYIDEALQVPYPIENHMYFFDKLTQDRFIDDLLSRNGLMCGKPRNFEEFLREQFGDTLYELYFKPYNEKIRRRDLKKIPLSWLEGKLPMPAVKEMIYNNMNHIEEKAFVHSTFWYEQNNGSQYIADRLAEGLIIKYNSDITSVKRKGEKWIVCDEEFDKVVFCGNIKDMAKMISGMDISAYREQIEALEYHGTTAVFCEIDANPYSWIYQPSRNHESHRIICTGNFAPTNNGSTTPEGRITATVEFTDEISQEDIMDNLSRIPFHPKYLDQKFNQYTYPVQDFNTRDMIKKLKALLAPSGFYFTGRFADWEYYNMDTAMGAAMDLCETL